MACEEMQTLISGYIDDELTQQELQRLRLHLEACPDCDRICQDLKSIRGKLGQLSYPESDTERLDKLENELISGTVRWTAWSLLLFGFMILAGFGLYQIFSNAEIPWHIRLGYGGGLLGLAILFLVVLRQRLMTYRNDKYRKVKL